MAAPPFVTGALHETVTWVSPRTTATPVGGLGTVDGTADGDATDDGPVPATFTATTDTVYPAPFVSPEIVQDVVDAVHDVLPGEAVATYEVIAAPPLTSGATHATLS